MAEKLLAQAKLLREQKEWQRAAEVYSEVLSDTPSAELFLERALCSFSAGDCDRTVQDCSGALELIGTSRAHDALLYECLSLRADAKKHSDLSAAMTDLNELGRKLSSQALKNKVQDKLKDWETDNEREQFVGLYRKHSEINETDLWYLVSSNWFKNWQGHVKLTLRTGYEDLPFLFNSCARARRPGPIDNSDIISQNDSRSLLVQGDFALKPGIQELYDFILLPARAFEFLQSKYECKAPLPRRPIELSDSVYQVEVFLKQVQVACPVKKLEFSFMQASRKSQLSALILEYLAAKQRTGDHRVWKINAAEVSIEKLGKLALTENQICLEGGTLVPQNLSVEEAELTQDDLLLVELPKDGQFLFTTDAAHKENSCGFCQSKSGLKYYCATCGAARYCSFECRKSDRRPHKKVCRPTKLNYLFRCFCRGPVNAEDSEGSDSDDTGASLMQGHSSYSRHGLTGLSNLGNTCFMNSAIQCLSHTTELTEYFFGEHWVKHINRHNPLGTKGKLANAYYETIHNLWKGKSTSCAPWKLKKVLAQFAPQFSGYQQHDSHELLCYLLDGLHEDLNQVKKKPYCTDDEGIGSLPECEVARLYWERHLARNKSIVIDLMHGQYKSTLYCPSCKNYSYTYDPFNSLSLPIPTKTHQRVPVYFIYAADHTPVQLQAEGNFSSLMGLRAPVAAAAKVPEAAFLFASIVNNEIKELLEDDRPLSSVTTTLFAYEIQEKHRNHTPVEVAVYIEGKSKAAAYSRLFFIKDSSPFTQLHSKTFKKIKQFLNTPTDTLPYKLQFSVSRECCGLCRHPSCRGCPVPSTSEIPSGSSFLRLRLLCARLPRNSLQVQRMNDCDSVASRKTSQTRSTTISIKECFSFFSQPEQLDRSNEWYCGQCKQHVRATKKMEIYSVPPILIIQLKRFKMTRHFREKLTESVQFPVTGLDLSEFVLGQRPGLYDLYAVSSHYGGLGGGHYTADCFNAQLERWVEFNDSHMAETRELSPNSSYILFYRLNNQCRK